MKEVDGLPKSPSADVGPKPTLAHTPGPWIYASRRLISVVTSDTIAEAGDRIKGRTLDEHPEQEAANGHLMAAAPDFLKASGGDLEQAEQEACGPLAWLRSAIDTLHEDAVRAVAEGDDPDAYDEMLCEVQRLHDGLRAAIARATAQ